MPRTEKGKFCGSCQKIVLDFTNLSDQQALEKLSSGGKLCGRFTSAQLNRELSVKKEKPSAWLAIVTGALLFLGNNDVVEAQEKPQTVDTGKTLVDVEPKASDSNGTSSIVSGAVSDETGTLPGANISNTSTGDTTQTDIDGNFSIAARLNDTLVFSYVGLIEERYVVKDSPQVKIILKMSGSLVGEIIISRKRSLFGQLFTWVGN
ncbi:MAG: hypothetical protein EOO48_13100, partial [Flavobacterium sp.]